MIRVILGVLAVYVAIIAALHFKPVPKREFELSLKARALHVITNIGRGSAIYLDKGIALSAAHVCDMFKEASTAFVVDAYKNKMAVEFYEIPKYNQEDRVDLCIIKFTPKRALPTTQLNDSDSIATGTQLYNPNYGGGEYYSLQIGVVTADMTFKVPLDMCFPPLIPCTKFERHLRMQSTSVPGIPGASGSGILDLEGKLVGVLVLGYGQSMSGIVPLDVVKEFLRGSKLAQLAQIN